MMTWINYEDFEKRRIHENFKETENLYEEAVFKNFDNKKAIVIIII